MGTTIILTFIYKAVDGGFILPSQRHIIVSAPNAKELVQKLEVSQVEALKLILVGVRELNGRLDRMAERENAASPTTSNLILALAGSNVSEYSWFTETCDEDNPNGQASPAHRFTYLELKAAIGNFGQVLKGWFDKKAVSKSGIKTAFTGKKLTPENFQELKELEDTLVRKKGSFLSMNS